VIWAVNGIGSGQNYLLEKADHAFLGILTALYLWGYTVGTSVSNPSAAALVGRVGYSGLTLFMVVPAAATFLITAVALPSQRVPAERSRASGGSKANPGYRDIAFRPIVLMLAAFWDTPICSGISP